MENYEERLEQEEEWEEMVKEAEQERSEAEYKEAYDRILRATRIYWLHCWQQTSGVTKMMRQNKERLQPSM